MVGSLKVVDKHIGIRKVVAVTHELGNFHDVVVVTVGETLQALLFGNKGWYLDVLDVEELSRLFEHLKELGVLVQSLVKVFFSDGVAVHTTESLKTKLSFLVKNHAIGADDAVVL